MWDAVGRIPFEDCHRPVKVWMSTNELGSADPARGRGSLDAARGETAWRRGFDGGLDGVMAGDWNFDGEFDGQREGIRDTGRCNGRPCIDGARAGAHNR